jgi:hypothetical protein
MTPPQVTAAVCFRVCAILSTGFGIINVLIILVFAGPAVGFSGAIPGGVFILGGILLFSVAPLLGRLAGIGLPTIPAPSNER